MDAMENYLLWVEAFNDVYKHMEFTTETFCKLDQMFLILCCITEILVRIYVISIATELETL